MDDIETIREALRWSLASAEYSIRCKSPDWDGVYQSNSPIAKLHKALAALDRVRDAFTAPHVDPNQEQDAARWRAFIGSARLRVMGSAGFGYGGRAPDSNGYRHIGIEVWSKHSAPSSLEDVTFVTAYADFEIARKVSETSP